MISLTNEDISSLIFRYKKIRPYEEQFKAGLELSKGNIVNQSTGEGKTISILIATLFKLSEGRKVFIVTSNNYLSKRDYQYSKEILESIGASSCFIEHQGSVLEYGCDVIYATGQTLIFDYLRGVKANYDFCIIDEVDYILVECAGHDFSVSDGDFNVKMPSDIFYMCSKLSNSLLPAYKTAASRQEDVLFDMNEAFDYVVDLERKMVSITTTGYEKLEKLFGRADRNLLLIEAMTATLLVKHFYNKDSEYIVKDRHIEIIDESNGRVMPGGSNDMFIQTAMEVKENLPITDKPLLCYSCAFPVFFTVFKDFSGISGTTSYVPYDFDVIYGKRIVKVKDHFPSKRVIESRWFGDKEKKDEFLKTLITEPGPFLIITSSDANSRSLFEELKIYSKKKILLLDNYDLEKEEEILKASKKTSVVLISSKIVGRGTDITLDKKLEDGLKVVIYNRLLSKRAEKQAIGRTARNGQKGSVYILTSYDDDIFYLKDAKDKIYSEYLINKLQDKYESERFEVRKHIFYRSKLFFDQDKAVRDRLSQIKSYKELLDVAKKSDIYEKDYVIKTLSSLIDRPFSSYFKRVLLFSYQKLKPIYQSQFIRYNDLMPEDLHNKERISYRLKECIQGSINVITMATYDALKATRNEK